MEMDNYYVKKTIKKDNTRVILFRVNSSTVEKKVTLFLLGLMDQSNRVNSKMVECKAKQLKSGLMDMYILATGIMVEYKEEDR